MIKNDLEFSFLFSFSVWHTRSHNSGDRKFKNSPIICLCVICFVFEHRYFRPSSVILEDVGTSVF